MPRYFGRTFFLILALALLSACASTPVNDRASAVAPQAADIAVRMIGKPYRYGGSSPRGFDCSGLVHYAYSQAGASVPRSTASQRAGTREVGYPREGDLLFFNQLGKASSHVAIYVGDGRFVHAPSTGKKVRLDSLSDPYWQRHLEDVRRF